MTVECKERKGLWKKKKGLPALLFFITYLLGNAYFLFFNNSIS